MTTRPAFGPRHVRWAVPAFALAGALWLGVPVAAQSPASEPTAGLSVPSVVPSAAPSAAPSAVPSSPSTVPSAAPSNPSASVRPDCAWLAGLLPGARDGATLAYEVKHGAETVTPSDVLDPLLLELGVQVDDLCQVVFWYGDPDSGQQQLLQFQGADAAALPDAFAGFFVKLYASYEETLVDGSTTIAGRAVRTLTDAGSPGQIFYIYPVGDALLLSGDQDVLALVLPGLPGPGEPIPQVTAPPGPVSSAQASPSS